MAPPRSARNRNVTAIAAPREFRTFDSYTAEADLPPFELPVSEGETLLFTCPTADDMKVISRAMILEDFEMLCGAAFGEQADRVWELAGGKPFPVIRAIVRDLMAHFQRALVNLPES